MKRSLIARWAVSSLAVLSILSAHAADASKPGAGVSITPIFPTIAEERFRGEIAVAGLKELGYNVTEPKETEFPAMYIALAYGDADFTVHNWKALHVVLPESRR
ncbi:glycine betaine/proline transport system substrate-binding protein [Pseudomonas sp. URMO17WK12:I6]|jgi:glycine betaine/proline transport system substrate-binding protein|nr:glycine betaine/proline transport system substrate-binding protein [Pseudomonas sp. URMO17WK12:I6]